MKQQHTPGPWAVVGEGTIKSGDLSIGEAYIYDENDYDYNPKSDDVRKKLPWMANARLMAASAELFEKLEELYNAYFVMEQPRLYKALAEAKKLIAKIEGDESNT